MNNVIDALKIKIQKLEQPQAVLAVPALSFGCPALDEHLPHDGLSLGALHEITATSGIVHETAATLFTAGILARMVGSVLWCVKTHDLFAPGLAPVGLEASRIIFAEADSEKTLLIIMEEGLRHGGLAAVVGEVNHLSLLASRRLHLAARASGVTAFALHRQRRYDKPKTKEPTAAVSCWRITALPSAPLPVAGIGQPYWQIDLLRCRDAETASWTLEACNEKGYLGLPANLAYGPVESKEHYATA